MTNTSYAKGTIHFKGFTFDEITNFVDANCFYSSDGYGFNDIYGEAFDGFGLDTFESTLKGSYWDFIPTGGRIELKFTDEERINGIYYIESGTIYDNGDYVVNTKEILSLKETLNMSEFNTVNDLVNDIKGLGWSTVKVYENGKCPSIWEIKNEEGIKRKINLDTILNYEKLEKELKN